MAKVRVKFDGVVYSRSSLPDAGGPPGEAAIFALNPERTARLVAATGWTSVFPGTLNLRVDHKHVEALAGLQPVVAELPPIYPEAFAGLAEKRGGHRYYLGRIKTRAGVRCPVLVRHAANPLKGVVEVLAEARIRDALALADGDTVNIRVVGEPEATTAPAPGRGQDAPRPHSFFFDARHRPVGIDGLYHGGHAFLIAGGPSFATLDKTPLAKCFTLCMNNAVRACAPVFRPNAWTLVDGADKFLYTAWQDPHILKLMPDYTRKKAIWNSDLDVPVGKRVQDCPGVVYFKRTSGFNADTFLPEPGACWGNSSAQKDANGIAGRRSVLLVALKVLYMLGFRDVYLLGVDFNMQPEQPYSFGEWKTNGACRGNNSTYAQLQWRFEQLRPRFEAAGYHVWNCNPASKLTAFDQIPYLDAVHRALGFAHDPAAYLRGELENVAGLYQTKWYVCPACGASSRWSKEDCKAGKAACKCGRAVTEEDRKKHAKDPDQRNIASGAE